MILFAVLVAAFAVSYLVLRHGRHRDAARWAMAVAMVFAGVTHFADPASFVRMLPEFVPVRHGVILGTGVIEILLGIGLLVPRRLRREVALALVAYLLAVFPANVHMAVNPEQVRGLDLDRVPRWALWARLPLQPLCMLWVWRATRN